MKQVLKYIFTSKYSKFMVIAMVVAMSVVSFGLVKGETASVDAAGEPCTIAINKNLTKSGKTVFAKVTVSGDANCRKPVTIAVWKSPTASGHPLSAQKLYTHTSKMLAPGKHTITANLPECSYWQADLLGQMRPTSIHGDANYDAMGQDALAGFLLGGKVCPVTPTTPVTPVTPTTPETPVSTVASVPEEVKGEELPNTGAGEIFLGLGSSTALGAAINAYIRSRKGLLSSIIG